MSLPPRIKYGVNSSGNPIVNLMQAKPQFFPASIMDETAYFMERAGNTTVTNGWTLTLEGEVDLGSVMKALLATFDCYPKYKCVLAKTTLLSSDGFATAGIRESVNPENVFQEMTAPGADRERRGHLVQGAVPRQPH